MEEEQDGKRGESGAAAGEEGGAVVAEDDSVVGDADDGENEQDHDGTQPTESRAEPEHVPRHRDPRRSVHGPPATAASSTAASSNQGGEASKTPASPAWMIQENEASEEDWEFEIKEEEDGAAGQVRARGGPGPRRVLVLCF